MPDWQINKKTVCWLALLASVGGVGTAIASKFIAPVNNNLIPDRAAEPQPSASITTTPANDKAPAIDTDALLDNNHGFRFSCADVPPSQMVQGLSLFVTRQPAP
ncbi:MAG: hypothetical protein ACOYK8_05610 [Alphaproteobacteria bacterium]